ncbi:MAG: S-adenosylhomocysteine deaminase [Flavobacteriales bacterium]|nr:S-adenosylhomocysteine deaminase [Flavobacteriales bacterium]|tara:strand:- start:328 stop:1461 length:1134 start_codon:yes stop_codon:yes gene_type:complete
MRFISADWIFPLFKDPIKNGVVQISELGEIIEVFSSKDRLSFKQIEVYNGIICPGFINAHCHLELSHLHNLYNKGSDFIDFIKIVKKRDLFSKDQIYKSIRNAENQMIKNGIVAVGDICNTSDTIDQKKKANLQYRNLLEVFQVNNEKVEETVNKAKLLKSQFVSENLNVNIVPHSSYSVTPKLMSRIKDMLSEESSIFSIHMQETIYEKKLFKDKTGPLKDWLISIDADPTIWESFTSPLHSISQINSNNILLVHNTYKEKKCNSNYYYCTCPNSNLLLGSKLPNYNLFDIERLCVGTDSLASNDKLSVLDELLTIQSNSNFSLETLLKIASKNGAKALNFNKLGTFEKGMIPGINLLQNIKNFELTEESKVVKLL